MKHIKLTLADEEYGSVKEAAGYEPMASYARRVLLGIRSWEEKAKKEVVAEKLEIPGVVRGSELGKGKDIKKRGLNLGGEPTGPKRTDYTNTW